MKETRVNGAIASGRLPLNIGDYVILSLSVVMSIGAIALVIMQYINPDSMNPSGMLGGAILVLLMIGYSSWKIIYQKALITCQSSLPVYKKMSIIEKLKDELNLQLVEKEGEYCKFCISKVEDSDEYTVIIIYNESGYAVNSISGSGRSRWLSQDKSQEIIGKIKNLEAHLI